MKIDKLYLEVNNDEVEAGRSRLGFGFRSVSTLNERPVIYIYSLLAIPYSLSAWCENTSRNKSDIDKLLI